MRKSFSKNISCFLCVILIFVAPLSGILNLELFPKVNAAEYNVGDIIEFGAYPQKQVTDSNLLSELNSLSLDWHTSSCYAGNKGINDTNPGSYYFGTMKSVNYGRFADVELRGKKYRVVSFSDYRTSWTTQQLNVSKIQKTNGYYTDVLYWFSYEPIEWVVLDPSQAIVMSLSILDAQAFSNTIYYVNGGYYSDSTGQNKVLNYQTSSLNNWLNSMFFDLAFSDREKQILHRTNTGDYVTISSIINPTYDHAYGSDFAKANGLWVDNNKSSGWWQNYGTNSGYNQSIGGYDDYSYAAVYGSHFGVRPVVYLDFLKYSSLVLSEVSEAKNVSINGGKGIIDISLDANWLAGNSLTYNHELAQFCSKMSVIGYADDNTIRNKVLAPLGFDYTNARIRLSENKKSVNHIFASKQVYINNRLKTIVIAGFIGSYHDQWISDFEPETGTIHAGFNRAKNIVKSYLNTFLEALHLNKEDTIIVFFGHSRGAAVTNLMAADYISEGQYNPNNIYAYAFATPNSSRDSVERNKPEYQRIFNIVNREDFVTRVLPEEWGYGNYGQTITLPCKSYDGEKWSIYKARMSYAFNQLRNETYQSYEGTEPVDEIIAHMTKYVKSIMGFYLPIVYGCTTPPPFALYDFFHGGLTPILAAKDKAIFHDVIAEAQILFGAAITIYSVNNPVVFAPVTAFFVKNLTKFAHAHMAETYAAFMMTLEENELRQDRTNKLCCVKCPVDIEVVNSDTGEIVAKIVNNQVDETIAAKENALFAKVEGDNKIISIPSEGEYSIMVIGNDNGTMDYSVSTVDAQGNELDRVNYFDVPVIKDMVMREDTVEDEEGNTHLAIVDESGEEIGTAQIVTSDEFDALAVTVYSDGVGNVSGAGQCTIGDYITLEAVTDENNEFLGYYEDDVLVASDNIYSFVARENHTLTARFTNNIVDVTGIEIGVDQKTEYDLTADDTIFLMSASIQPVNATEKRLVWTSSDEDVAIVTESGLVTLQSAGTVTLTVTTPDGNYSDEITLTISNPSPFSTFCPICGRIHSNSIVERFIAFFHRLVVYFSAMRPH